MLDFDSTETGGELSKRYPYVGQALGFDFGCGTECYFDNQSSFWTDRQFVLLHRGARSWTESDSTTIAIAQIGKLFPK